MVDDDLIQTPKHPNIWGGGDAAPTVLYAGHDTRSGVKVSNGPVRRNQIAEDKFSPVRARMKEV